MGSGGTGVTSRGGRRAGRRRSVTRAGERARYDRGRRGRAARARARQRRRPGRGRRRGGPADGAGAAFLRARRRGQGEEERARGDEAREEAVQLHRWGGGETSRSVPEAPGLVKVRCPARGCDLSAGHEPARSVRRAGQARARGLRVFVARRRARPLRAGFACFPFRAAFPLGARRSCFSFAAARSAACAAASRAIGSRYGEQET